ncbi:MAG: hypothetical protein JO051_06400 [Acidobacteriaceae bacterium]|nr:hypothetical protein [Acidobacteriaceae bacterium]
MGALALDIFLKFILPVLVRQGVTMVTAAAAGHGVAVGSSAETIVGSVLTLISAGFSAWRGTPNNLLKRAAAHPDPAVASIVKEAADVAVGHTQPQI